MFDSFGRLYGVHQPRICVSVTCPLESRTRRMTSSLSMVKVGTREVLLLRPATLTVRPWMLTSPCTYGLDNRDALEPLAKASA